MTNTYEVVSDVATVVLVLGMVLAGVTSLVYGIGSRWYDSLLGVAFLAVTVVSSLPLVIIVTRRAFGRYPGTEWVSLGLFSLFTIAWVAMLTIVLIERNRAPVAVTFRKKGRFMSDNLSPAALPDGSALVRADARQRSFRTLLQGLAIDVLVAVGTTVLLVLGTLDDSELLTAGAWIVIATSVGKSVLTAVASFLARLAVPPSTPPEPLT